jgi:glycolate oxidase FAD binding subunit
VDSRVNVRSPGDYDEVAALLRASGEERLRVRPVGGRTKLGWGAPGEQPGLELSTAMLDRVLEHNEGDLTAVVQAGVPLARAQQTFARAGQMLALDPPLGGADAATLGGIVATADSGPLRHRYGAPRDLVIGITVALSDGTIAKSGGKVIKNVAGYDLAKLFTGSFGTLGVIVQVALRLHPLPASRATARGISDDPGALARAAAALAHAPLEPQCLDVRWEAGGGAVLVRFAGTAAAARAEAVLPLLEQHTLEATVVADDEEVWARQREAQRSVDGTVVKVSSVPTRLADALRVAARTRGSLTGRAALGLSWITLPEADAGSIEQLRRELAPARCVVLDAPEELHRTVDVWGDRDGALAVMRRVKERFDVHGVCNPGVFVGGI